MPRELKPCGTVAAYQRHVRLREPIDDACRDAMRTYQRVRRTGTTEPREVQPCGTNAAYARHLSHGEKACDACLKAHSEYMAADPKRDGRSSTRARAISELIRRHRDEFLTLLAAKKAKETNDA